MAAIPSEARVVQPIAQPKNDGALAPWPVIDRYPVVIGPGLSLAYVSSIFRLSLLGYRQQYVDLLDELLEKEPHGFSVLSKRILAVADGKVTLSPAECEESEKKLAQEIADDCARKINRIPNLHQHMAALLWALYRAIEACEVHWTQDTDGWRPARLSFVHSRRLQYSVAGSWDLYISDSGQVLQSQSYGEAPTNKSIFGLRVADYPGKFVVHAPQMRGQYPTRDGLGRQLAYWFVLKLIAARGGAQYLERFARPWPEASYTTSDDGKPRAADDDDIDAAKAAMRSMGAGSLASWVHPDTIKLDLRTPDGSGAQGKLSYREWIEICNGEISKGGTGSTLTTEVGSTGGNRALGEVHSAGDLRNAKYDAKTLAETFKRDLVWWMVHLNYPGKEHLTPSVRIIVEPDPSPSELIDRGAKAASVGFPVDADKLGEQAGLPLVKPGDTKARRLMPYKVILPTEVDPDIAAKAATITPPETEEMGSDGKTKPNDDKSPDETPDDEEGQ
jgi:phage gp29-like protein